MARLNRPNVGPRTHEGAPAVPNPSPLDTLRRTVLACMLWEDGFYESGATIAERITLGVQANSAEDVRALALEARLGMHLRHVPLLLAREMARTFSGAIVGATIRDVIQRPDELCEFLAIYWKDGKVPLSKQVKRGLAEAFIKFNAYQLAKYNRDGAIKLRDVLFLVHAKPKNDEQAAVWKQLVDGTLPAPDTWEVALSDGADKRETFERLIAENKLGYMALLRNLRNMQQAGVSINTVLGPLLEGAAQSKALPFRFVSAARAVPAWEPVIDQAMQAALGTMDKLPGKTVVMVDVSGSMSEKLSAKSDLTRMDAACALAALVRGISDDCRIISFSNGVVEVPPRNGMALIDAINRSQTHAGTYLGAALENVKTQIPDADRIIVVTDEQSNDVVGGPGKAKGYMINVASGKNGVGYGPWTRITGFSEAVINYIQVTESEAGV